MKHLYAGRLDRRIAIQNPIELRNATGEKSITWPNGISVWAGVEPLNGREGLESDQITAMSMTKFYIRFISAISEKSRIVYNGKNYDIHSIRELGRREGLEIIAKVTDKQ